MGRLICFQRMNIMLDAVCASSCRLSSKPAVLIGPTSGSSSATSSLPPTCRRACCRPPCRGQPLCSGTSQHSSSQQERDPTAASRLPASSTSRAPSKVGVDRHQAPSCCRPGKQRVRRQRPRAQRGGQQLPACQRRGRQAAAAAAAACPDPGGAPGQEAAPAGGSW